MMQVENEYGSYGEDKSYLRAIRKLMEDRGIDCPFTSDGPWRATLKAGTLIEDDLFVTETSVLKLRTTFHRCRNSFLMSMARNGPSCVWNSGMVGSTVGKNPSSLVILKNWQKLFERYWSKALSTLHVPWWYKLWFHEWLLGSRTGFATSHLTTMMPFSMKKIQL